MVRDMSVATHQNIRLGQVEQPLQAAVRAVRIQVFVDPARAAVHEHDPEVAKL